MAIRNIIKIDEVKCNGCGKCIVDCAEGALKLVDGKARLVRDDFCDGLGACIGSCPQGAITFEQRDAAEFDEAAVQKHLAAAHSAAPHGTAPMAAAGCPGLQLLNLAAPPADALTASPAGPAGPSELTHWPIQLALIPPTAPFLRGCDLLFAADCAPLAVPDFHARFLRTRKVVLGCPKLDDRESYVGKLAAIVEQADLRSLTIVHMEVPCCMALAQLAQAAFQRAGKQVPTREVTVSRTGQVLSQRDWP
jgi:Fe-S-cluster-containing hydrogenase component 2